MAVARLGGRRAERRAERRRQHSSEGAGRLGEGRGGDSAIMKPGEEAVQSPSFLKRRELLLRSGCPYFKYSARRARITSS